MFPILVNSSGRNLASVVDHGYFLYGRLVSSCGVPMGWLVSIYIYLIRDGTSQVCYEGARNVLYKFNVEIRFKDSLKSCLSFYLIATTSNIARGHDTV